MDIYCHVLPGPQQEARNFAQRSAQGVPAGQATEIQLEIRAMPRWRKGRRGGLKIRSPQGGVGSIPTLGTRFC